MLYSSSVTGKEIEYKKEMGSFVVRKCKTLDELITEYVALYGNENIEKEYQKLLETLSPEQEKVITKYCDEIFASGAETEEFFYRLGIKDGLRLKSTVKSVLEMMS